MARILVVEDSPSVRELAAGLLGRAGHDCETAENGLEGLRRAMGEDVPFDVILSDADMPLCSGLELLDALLRSDAGPVRFLLMSGTYREDEIDLSVAHPNDRVSFMAKPFRAQDLYAHIDALLDGPASCHHGVAS